MNVPNSLTLARIFFVPLLVAALVQEDVSVRLGDIVVTNEWLALAIFLAAAGTDILDGFLARRWSQVTTIGTLLDPIAARAAGPAKTTRPRDRATRVEARRAAH